MVVSLAEEKMSYSPQQLDALSSRVKKGDLSDVLKLYEDDMKVSLSTRVRWAQCFTDAFLTLLDSQSPLKSALAGSLIRSLLIQVQKTKVRSDPFRVISKLALTTSLASDTLTGGRRPGANGHRPPPALARTHLRVRRSRAVAAGLVPPGRVGQVVPCWSRRAGVWRSIEG